MRRMITADTELFNFGDVSTFDIGDFVTSAHMALGSNFYGVVIDVCPVAEKICVEWAGGMVKQHSPDELQFHPVFTANRRVKTAADVPPNYTQDPETHGLDTPVAGGTNVMKNLVDSLAAEHMQNIQEEKHASLRSRRALYHHQKGRVYKRSKGELEEDVYMCPSCDKELEKQNFVKGVALFVCPKCDWKVPSNKLV